jgi:enterochelin esterase-like enzyme
LGPTSIVVLVLLLVGAVALITAVAVVRQIWLKIPAAALCLVVSVFSGAIVVNDFFDYYTSWGAALADLTGNGNSYAVQAAESELHRHGATHGRLTAITLRGAQSGISREGLVYLPPQYGEPGYRSTRFPVLELLHGTPGDPSVWVSELRIVHYISELIAHRRMGPVVLVMPDSNGGLQNAQECLDTPAVQDDTYISADVPADIRQRYRVSTDPAQWGLVGFSSGGYCAANLALRHRADFGSAAIIDGYFWPAAGPAAARLGFNSAAELANDPLHTALSLPPGLGPLPACWLAAGTGDRSDYQAARKFLRAMSRLESVPLYVMKGQHHTALADRDALPAALTWSWQQLATPAQRRAFPTLGAPTAAQLATGPTPRRSGAPVLAVRGHNGASR